MNRAHTVNSISRFTYEQLVKWGVSEEIAEYVNLLALLFIVIVLVYVVHNVVRRLLRITLINLFRRTKIAFFGNLLEYRFAHFLALSAPLVIVKGAIPIVLADFPYVIGNFHKLADIYMILIIIWMLVAVVKACANTLRESPVFKSKPIDSYIQVVRIVLFTIGLVMVFSILTGKSPITFFTAMGAISAILLLMFKDTIMGFVASIQVTANDMVRIGDWITMTKYGADGDVIEINLTTVKVQNFDKTITTIPTYALISDSFQNWRGMQQFGGRRIKRAIYIKQLQIKFLTPEEIEKYRKIQSIQSYIDHRQKDIDKNNDRMGADKSVLINGRNLTNAGLYRKYIDSYLANHTGTNKKMTMMVRQLAPTANGLPLEIYAFANTTKWVDYEHIQADIFDHLLASARYFELDIFELEGAGDVKPIRFTEPVNHQSLG
jgi:miniconductance mechanosensitive channel